MSTIDPPLPERGGQYPLFGSPLPRRCACCGTDHTGGDADAQYYLTGHGPRRERCCRACSGPVRIAREMRARADSAAKRASVRASGERWKERNPDAAQAYRRVRDMLRARLIPPETRCADCGQETRLIWRWYHDYVAAPRLTRPTCTACHGRQTRLINTVDGPLP